MNRFFVRLFILILFLSGNKVYARSSNPRLLREELSSGDSLSSFKPIDIQHPQQVHHYLGGLRVNRDMADSATALQIRCPLSIYYGEGITQIQSEEEKDIYPVLERFIDSVMTTLDTNKHKEVALFVEGFDDEFSFYYDKAKYLEQKYEVDQLDLTTYHAMISYERAMQVSDHLEKHWMIIGGWSAKFPNTLFHISCSGNGDEVPLGPSGKIPEVDKRRTVKIYFILS